MKPTITRGRITIPAKGVSKTFMYNPNDVTDNKAVQWAATEIPGSSEVVYSYGSGGERLFTFDLYLDGDRGRFGRGGGVTVETLSVMNDIRFYQSLTYPQQYGDSAAKVFPYTLLFSFGPMYDNIPVIMKKCSVKIDYWTPKLEPVRATLSMEFGEISDKAKTAEEHVKGNDLLFKAGGIGLFFEGA